MRTASIPCFSRKLTESTPFRFNICLLTIFILSLVVYFIIFVYEKSAILDKKNRSALGIKTHFLDIRKDGIFACLFSLIIPTP